MAIRILGICGSPHKNGNTIYALKHALAVCRKEGARTRRVELADKNIAQCNGCFACIRTGKCVIQDDMKAVVASLRWCDGLLLASPVWLGMVSGRMKTMMDRSVILRRRWPLKGKIGAGIACGAFRNGGQELTLVNMQTYFLQMDMQSVSDGPPYSHSGATIVGQASEDALGLETVANVASRMVAALRNRAAGRG